MKANTIQIFTLFLAGIFLLMSCTDSSKKSPSDSVNAEPEIEKKMNQNIPPGFGEKYADAWSGQNAEAHAAFFAPGGSQIVNNGTPAIGRDAITEVAQGYMTTFPDMLVVCDSLPATSKGVEFHWTLTGTNTGPGGTGKKVHISGVEVLLFDSDGLIAESNGSFDADEYNRQLKEGFEK